MASLDSSDAVILGSPTYMGGPSGQFKCFADVTGERWFKSAWRDKLAAGFTVSGGPNGEQLSTLHYFFALAMQDGMVWVERQAARLRAAAAHFYPGSLVKTRLTKTQLWQTRT